MSNTRRFRELDSLRGVAAVMVFFSHAVSIYSGADNPPQFRIRPVLFAIIHSPIHTVWGGHSAVILFFVLSGFVLSVPFNGQDPPPWSAFCIKRICRIWIPYAGAVLFSIALRSISQGRPEGMSHFFDSLWRGALSPRRIMLMLALVIHFDYRTVNVVFWSLVHEMRISLAFPLLIMATRRMRWGTQLILAIALSMAALLSVQDGDAFSTVHYSAFFVLGNLVFVHADKLRIFASRHPRTFAGMAIMLFSYSVALEWTTAIGAAMLIILCLSNKFISEILLRPKLEWIGARSYSIYLCHLPILLAAVYISGNRLHPVALAAISGLCVAVASNAFYRLIEIPAISLARVSQRKMAGNIQSRSFAAGR